MAGSLKALTRRTQRTRRKAIQKALTQRKTDQKSACDITSSFRHPPSSLAPRSTPNAGTLRRASSKGGQTEAHMRLNVPAFALTAGLFWAMTVFLVQTLNALLP